MHNLADNIEKLRQVAVAKLVSGPNLRRKPPRPFTSHGKIRSWPGRSHTKGHIGILRIGDDERFGGSVGFKLRKFDVQGFAHGADSPACAKARRYKASVIRKLVSFLS